MGYDYYDNYLGNAVNATNTAVTIGGVFAIIFAVIYALIIIAIAVLTVIGLWKVFEKNKMPGWYAVIPGFNIWMYFELNKIPGWAIFLPGANVIYLAIASYRLCTKMGKDLFFSVINFCYPFVGLLILGFGKAQPIEEKKSKKEDK